MAKYLQVDIDKKIIQNLDWERTGLFYRTMEEQDLKMGCGIRSEGRYRKVIPIIQGDANAALPALNAIPGFSVNVIEY